MDVQYAPPEKPPEGIVTVTLTETEAKLLASSGQAERNRWGVGNYNSRLTVTADLRRRLKDALGIS